MLPTRMTSLLNIHWNILQRYTIDPEPYFLQAGINPDLCGKPGVRCKVEQARQLWEMMVAEIEDPCFGLKAAECWHPSDLGALGYAALASRTLEDTIERINRYQFAILGEYTITTSTTPKRYTVTLCESSLPQHYTSDDATLAIILSICRVNYRSPLFPEQTSFKHAAPACRAEYENIFGDQVSFSAPTTSMTFSRDVMQKILSSKNEKLIECSDEILEDYLKGLDREDFIEKTKIVILRHLSTGKSLEQRVAPEMYMSKRNFQRELKKHQVTFREILNDLREQLAKHYLLSSQMTIPEIAFILGYSNASTFSRAFSNRTGTTPKSFSRNRL